MVAARAAGVPFGPKAITGEINRTFKDQLQRPIALRHVSVVLQRLADAGVVKLLRAGRPHQEALYSRQG